MRRKSVGGLTSMVARRSAKDLNRCSVEGNRHLVTGSVSNFVACKTSDKELHGQSSWR